MPQLKERDQLAHTTEFCIHMSKVFPSTRMAPPFRALLHCPASRSFSLSNLTVQKPKVNLYRIWWFFPETMLSYP